MPFIPTDPILSHDHYSNVNKEHVLMHFLAAVACIDWRDKSIRARQSLQDV